MNIMDSVLRYAKAAKDFYETCEALRLFTQRLMDIVWLIPYGYGLVRFIGSFCDQSCLFILWYLGRQRNNRYESSSFPLSVGSSAEHIPAFRFVGCLTLGVTPAG